MHSKENYNLPVQTKQKNAKEKVCSKQREQRLCNQKKKHKRLQEYETQMQLATLWP